MTYRTVTRLALCCAAFSAALASPAAQAEDDRGIEFFEKKIRPVLVKECYVCHSGKAVAEGKLKGNLRLDSKDAILRGGDSGPALVPGKPEESLLIDALHFDGLEMPPGGKLDERIVADFEKWVTMGAPDPRKETAAAPLQKPSIDFAAARKFWSFQPPHRYPQPQVSQPEWIRRPIDGFILRRLEAEQLSPSPPADRRTWFRRVTFDLTGLPPTPESMQEFLADDSPEAQRRAVDRLLSSPHYGEHWARMWLDIARYAEDQAHIVGNDTSLCYPNAYLYRDWVIQALNDDLPYDKFIRLQLAADLIDPEHDTQYAALGFIGLGPKYYRRNSPEVMADEWEDRVDVVSRGLLGLTVACARCHDHKYDPIATEDYYALAGVFASTDMYNRPLNDKVEKGKDGKQAKKPEEALHVVKEDKPTDLPVYIRGDVNNRGPVVKRRFLQILDADAKPFEHGSGREDLAEAIVDPQNPLTARVIVNRVWAHYFDRPLVGTPSNFGALGDEPTHPQLLDDVAVRFMENGWSFKWLHREIVLSATYGQNSLGDSRSVARDPDNRLLARMPRKRLSAEQWRDAVLAVSGRLDPRIGGPSIDPQATDERRRTLYSRISRLELNKMLSLFDYPDPNVHSEQRVETTTPLQKLFVMNSPFMLKQAEALAERLIAAGPDLETRVDSAYQLCYSRSPTDEELRLALDFFGKDAGSADMWTEYAQVLLASNELLFVD